jgi:hypothetical protein
MNTQKSKIVEGISGMYPQMSLWQEFGSAVATGIFLLLPVIFHKLRVKLSETDLAKYTSEILKRVKVDKSRDSIKSKIARAVQAVMDNPNVPNMTPQNYEQLTLNLLPNNIENKSEEEVETYINKGRERLNLPPVKTIRG